jgi:hypothetical protein
MSWAKIKARKLLDLPARETNPVYFRGGTGEEKYPLTEEEKAQIRSRRIGGHARFMADSKWTGRPVRKYDSTVALIHRCQRCFEEFYDDIGTEFCDRCRGEEKSVD